MFPLLLLSESFAQPTVKDVKRKCHSECRKQVFALPSGSTHIPQPVWSCSRQREHKPALCLPFQVYPDLVRP